MTDQGRVTRAVIPAAGWGTRFLPATKSAPKAMLPIVDTPSIQYVVEEAVRAGLSDVLVITSRNAGVIEDHFTRNAELEDALEAQGKVDLLAELKATNDIADMHYVCQRDPLGLGHAIAMAREHVGDHTFAVLLADDIMFDDARLLRSMLAVHDQDGGSVLALMEMTREEISAYGCAEVEPVRDGVVRVHSVVEKPRPEDAPSNLAVIGRYVLTPAIFSALDRTQPGVGGEIQITDAIGLLLEEEPVYGVVFSQGRYDIGQKLDFLRANIEVALDRPDMGPDLAAILSDVMRRRGIT